MTFKVHTRPDFQRDDIELHIIHTSPTGQKGIVTNLTMFAVAPGGALPANPGRIMAPEVGDQRQFLQAMLEAAWEVGMRPAGYSDVAGSMRAGEAHLQDMRAIAFAKLEVPKP